MRTPYWQPLPAAESTVNIFEIPGPNAPFEIDDFMTGVGTIIRAARELPITQELKDHASVPMRHILDEIEESVRQTRRTEA